MIPSERSSSDLFWSVHYFKLKKYFFEYEIGYILIDLSYVFPMLPSEFKISILVESYDEKTAENYRNDYVAEIWLLIGTLFA